MKPFRLRSKQYLAHIRSKPCLICGANWSDPHHVTYAQLKGKAVKSGDQYAVPLCRKHHMELHESPLGERTFWAMNGIIPLVWADKEYSEWREANDDDLPA